MDTTNGGAYAKSSRRGRRTHTPTTILGTYIQKRLDTMGITRTELARRLRVSPSTIGRLLNGDTKVVQRVSVYHICEALGLDDMQRREFLELVGSAGIATFALATGAHVSKAKKYKIDLDMADDLADALDRLRQQGEVKYVMGKAQQWYDKLLREQPYEKDVRLAATQMRFGVILGYTQEFALPWYQRSSTAIQTYNSIEQNIIFRFSLNTFRQEYANVISHRAPLYREMGIYDESAKQFEDGIYWIKDVFDPWLRTSLFRSRAHVSAVQGKELQWLHELDEARRDAQLVALLSHEALGMIDYVEGEGYKRLAFNVRKELAPIARAEYAKRALHSFAQSRYRTLQQPVAHHMLVRLSEAQCLTWIDPEEAIVRAEKLKEQAILQFPALLDKINRTIYFARQRLLARRSDAPLLFDLDAHPKLS